MNIQERRKWIGRRADQLVAEDMDAGNALARAELEARCHAMRRNGLAEEYRRVVSVSCGWEWRAVSGIFADRLRRLERKDHTRWR